MHRDREIKLIGEKVLEDFKILLNAFRNLRSKDSTEIRREASRLRRHARNHRNRVLELERGVTQ